MLLACSLTPDQSKNIQVVIIYLQIKGVIQLLGIRCTLKDFEEFKLTWVAGNLKEKRGSSKTDAVLSSLISLYKT